MVKYIIINTEEIGLVSFTELISDSIDTVRYSVDATECILRYEGDKPLSLYDCESASAPKTQKQIKIIGNGLRFTDKSLVE